MGKQEKPAGVVVEVVVSVSVVGVVMVASANSVSVIRQVDSARGRGVARTARATAAAAKLGDEEAVAGGSSVKPQSVPSFSVELAELMALRGKQENLDADVASVNFVIVVVRYSVDVNVSVSVTVQVFASQKPSAAQ